MAERVLVAVAVIAIVAIEVGYLLLIRSQGGVPSDTPWVVPFVAGYLVLMAAALALSLVVPDGLRPALSAAASAGLLVLGLLAAFSIGLAVLVVAGLSIAVLVLDVRTRPGTASVLPVVAGAVAAAMLLGVGFQISWTHIVCPPNGESGGSVAGFFGGSAYDCNDGILTYR